MNSEKNIDVEALEFARYHFSMGAIEDILNAYLQNLLNTKSLYQSMSISDNHIVKVFLRDAQSQFDSEIRDVALKHLKKWMSTTLTSVYKEDFEYKTGQHYAQIKIPCTVKTYCEFCKEVTTHNPKGCGDCYTRKDERCFTHVFHAEYECQDCKFADTSFMVMRRGCKIQVVGRAPIEIATISKGLSSQLRNDEKVLFGDAIMANKTGSVLAAVCLLRIALERYLRRVADNIKAEELVSGDELYEQYKKRLPEDFCYGRVVPLGKIYNDLSAVMHSAEVPDGCFERNYANIELFFRFLSLMPLQK